MGRDIGSVKCIVAFRVRCHLQESPGRKTCTQNSQDCSVCIIACVAVSLPRRRHLSLPSVTLASRLNAHVAQT